MPRYEIRVRFTTEDLDQAKAVRDDIVSEMQGLTLPDEVSVYPPVELATLVVETKAVGQITVPPKTKPSIEQPLIIYTDGGCDKGRIGAWCFIVENPNGEAMATTGHELDTTNNRMEMTAVIEALKSVEIGTPLRIVCDSEYVIKGCTLWARNWIKNGWKNYQGKPVINRDLWEELLALYALHTVGFEHVKGHTGHIGNELCDKHCTEEIIRVNKAILAGGIGAGTHTQAAVEVAADETL
jgi:ribonuclease HI